MQKPDFIKHWSEVLDEDNSHYDNSDEILSYGAPLGKKTGMTKIGVHHEILPPGRRTSFPHAESEEEEFAYVLQGAPDVRLNGEIFRLKAGDFVGMPAGTGIAHTFINNTNEEVRLLVGGHTKLATNKVFYPMNPERNAAIPDYVWSDCPPQQTGSHDGLPDRLRIKANNP